MGKLLEGKVRDGPVMAANVFIDDCSYLPGTTLSSHLTSLNLGAALGDSHYYYPHFELEETEAQGSEAVHRQRRTVAGSGFKRTLCCLTPGS